MAIDMLTPHHSEYYFATPKQIKDWHNYTFNANVWMHRLFEIGKIDLKRIEYAYRRVLEKHQVLRSIFRMNDDRNIVRIVLPLQDPIFSVKVFRYTNETELQAINDNISKDLYEARIDQLASLIVMVTYLNPGGEISVRLLVHHIICNGSSFEKLVRDLFYFYETEGEEKYSHQFQDYAKANFEQHKSTFWESYNFLKNHFNRPACNIVGPPKLYEFEFEEKFNNALSNEVYYVSTLTPEERISKKGAAIIKAMSIKDFQRLRKRLTDLHLFFSTIIFACFSKVLCSFFPSEKRYFGSLFDDSNIDYDVLGDFTADVFFDANAVTTLSVAELTRIQNHINKLYEHPIFNFNFYSIDENQLFGTNCPAYLNFNIYESDYDPTKWILDQYEEVMFSGVGLQPGIDVYNNGYIVVRWQFDESKYSRKQIEEMDRIWRESLVECRRNIENTQ